MLGQSQHLNNTFVIKRGSTKKTKRNGNLDTEYYPNKIYKVL